ncbi:hypothetical protein [Actinomadura rugatobispora]|uniref:Uncharacterized protein n=1 Tax=Actinomadura rugatobispora TaxID=1994 RepID=A0ABW1A182_9ACTN
MADERDRPPATGPGGPPETPAAQTGTATDPGVAAGANQGAASHRRGSRMGRPPSRNLKAARKRAAAALATALSVITTVVVLVLAVHIVFVVFEANTANDLVRTAGDRAEGLAWQFRDVFQPADPKIEVVVNYGLAALVYLIIGRIVVGLVRRLD